MRMRDEHDIKALENNNIEILNDTLNNIGHTLDDKEKVVPANVWVATTDKAQSKADQQCTSNKYYYYVHGSRLVEPENKRREVSYFYSCFHF